MKTWKCLVCGYIHRGNEPPEKCPVCGADRDKFVEVTESDSESKNSPEMEAAVDNSPGIIEKMTSLIVEKHLHPITVHGPNGIIPMVVLFLVLAVVFQLPGFESAAYFSMIFVLLSMPPVLFSGYVTWQKKYKGTKTSLFKIKIVSSCVATVLLFVLVVWKTVQPDVLSSASLDRFIFLFWSLFMLAAVGIAGHLGGQLVFANKE